MKYNIKNPVSVKISCRLMLLMFASVSFYIASAQLDPVIVTENKVATVEKKAWLFLDSTGKLLVQNVLTDTVKWIIPRKTPVFQVTNSNIWMQFALKNKNSSPELFIEIEYANISNLVLYQLKNGVPAVLQHKGMSFAFNRQERTSPNFIFPIYIKPGQTVRYVLKISSRHPLLLPTFIRTAQQLKQSEDLQTIITGMYAGIIIAIFFYNLFLFVSTLDKSYLVYVLFLFFLGIAQLTVSGYTFKYLWPAYPGFNSYALVFTSAMAGITGIYFSMFFLRLKNYTPRLTWFFLLLIVAYVASILCNLAGYNNASYQLLNINGITGGISLLIISWYVARKGYKPAYFYFFAWISFLLGLVIFGLRNYNVLPYNYFTTYILYVGSAIEAILLSIALADKINILRKEKEVSQANALRVSQENEKLVRETNVELERKVLERTEALQMANEQLENAFGELKGAQTQLVEAEKMASLGQLTAGIAHEINNPINFVKSNIKPLKLDVNDLFEVIDAYGALHGSKDETIEGQLKSIDELRQTMDMGFLKEEIYSLMKGIEDGADRTAEIVQGLRNFSRLDESQLKTVNVHEGLNSTLVILRNITPENISIVKNFTSDGEIECYPGKLNQVFMNILNNSIQAIKEKGLSVPGSIHISTSDISPHEIEIRIKDTGVGMPPDVKQKIFDPFFTTKDVGEGTGLGLAIVFKIIQEHQGKIEVISHPGEGAEFRITLHRTIPMKTP